MANVMFALLSSSRNGSLRLAVRAFTASTTAPFRSTLASRSVRPTLASLYPSQKSLIARFSTSTVEEDLDAALDDILGGADDALDDILGEAFLEAENPADMEPGTHMKGSHPMPEALVAKVRLLGLAAFIVIFFCEERFSHSYVYLLFNPMS